jgi:hypothetical protein
MRFDLVATACILLGVVLILPGVGTSRRRLPVVRRFQLKWAEPPT